MRFDHGLEPFGGRRVLREILRFNQLSEEHVTQHSLTNFWNLQWYGDKYDQLVAFQNVVLRATDAANRCGLMDSQITAKLATLIRSSSRLAPAFHVYEQTHRSCMDWRELLEIITREVDVERSQRIEAEARGTEGRKPGGDGKKPGLKPGDAAPGLKVEPPYVAVLRKHPKVCRLHLYGACTKPNCPFTHMSLPPSEADALKAAHEAKRVAEGKPAKPTAVDARSDGSASPGGKPRRMIGICLHYQRGEVCPRMPECKWRHGESAAELERVQALRSRKPAGAEPMAELTAAVAVPFRAGSGSIFGLP